MTKQEQTKYDELEATLREQRDANAILREELDAALLRHVGSTAGKQKHITALQLLCACSHRFGSQPYPTHTVGDIAREALL